MKTFSLFATALILTSVASAQHADIQSKSTAGSSVSASKSGADAKVSAQNTNTIKAEPISPDNKASIEKSVNGSVNQSVTTTEGIASSTKSTVATQSNSAVTATQSTGNKVEASAKKPVKANANTSGSVNTNIRPVSLKSSSLIHTGAGLGL